MPSVYEFFKADARHLSLGGSWSLTDQASQTSFEVYVSIAYAFENKSKFMRFYLPPEANALEVTWFIIQFRLVEECQLSEEGDGVSVFQGHVDVPELQMDSARLIYTRKLLFYIDSKLTDTMKM